MDWTVYISSSQRYFIPTITYHPIQNIHLQLNGEDFFRMNISQLRNLSRIGLRSLLEELFDLTMKILGLGHTREDPDETRHCDHGHANGGLRNKKPGCKPDNYRENQRIAYIYSSSLTIWICSFQVVSWAIRPVRILYLRSVKGSTLPLKSRGLVVLSIENP